MLRELPSVMAIEAVAMPSSGQLHEGVAVWFRRALICALLVWLYWSVVPAMVVDWWTEEGYSYGFLIPPIAAYLAWIRRHAIAQEADVRDSRGVYVVFLGCLVYLLGILSLEYFLSRISLVIILTGLIWTLWGMPRLKLLAFPLLLLATMVPLPTIVYYQLTTPLQLLASSVATTIMQSCGVAVYRDGNVLQLATTSLGVAEACSGLRSASALAVSALFVGYLECRRLRNRVAVLLLALPLSVALNVLRVTGTALLAEGNPDMATGFYHLFTGWLVYITGFAALFLLARVVNVLIGDSV